MDNEERQRRIDRAVRTLATEIGESRPSVEERIRDLAQELGLTPDEIREAWERTTFG